MNTLASIYQDQPHDDLLARPWAFFVPSSGSYQNISARINRQSGVTAWLNRILEVPEENAHTLTTPEVPNVLAEIRDTFSLSTVQLAQIAGVSRQAVYDWNSGKPVKPEHRLRITKIHELAREWQSIHPKTMGAIVGEVLDGTSVLSLLSAEVLDTKTITAMFLTIATKLVEADATRPLSARDLATKHGLEPLSQRDLKRNLQNTLLGSSHGR